MAESGLTAIERFRMLRFRREKYRFDMLHKTKAELVADRAYMDLCVGDTTEAWGRSFCQLVFKKRDDWHVMELTSSMLCHAAPEALTPSERRQVNLIDCIGCLPVIAYGLGGGVPLGACRLMHAGMCSYPDKQLAIVCHAILFLVAFCLQIPSSLETAALVEGSAKPDWRPYMRNAWLAWGMLAGKHFLDLSCKLLAATCMQRVHLSVVQAGWRTRSRGFGGGGKSANPRRGARGLSQLATYGSISSA